MHRLRHGDCFEVIKTIPEGSVDVVVCDPPYGLEFMGRSWDRLEGGFSDGGFKRMRLPSITSTKRNVKCPDCGRWEYDHVGKKCRCGGVMRHKLNSMQAWHTGWLVQVERVLEPGGYAAAFCATRTVHRLAAAMEDAGLEVCGLAAWTYGSGFPKSLDISKALDKAAGAERPVIGPGRWAGLRVSGSGPSHGDACYGEYGVPGPETAPATDEAKEWDGWGTALKPAWEPVIIGRKP